MVSRALQDKLSFSSTSGGRADVVYGEWKNIRSYLRIVNRLPPSCGSRAGYAYRLCQHLIPKI
jgi:hypothetical protein